MFKKRATKLQSSVKTSKSLDDTSPSDDQQSPPTSTSPSATPEHGVDVASNVGAKRKTFAPLTASTKEQQSHDDTTNPLAISSATSTRSVTSNSGNASQQAAVDVSADQLERRKVRGPTKPTAANVRAISMMDYKPDICKDYKQTGFCSFGDSCKFLHDRGDYALGWQVEAAFEKQQAKRRKLLSEGKTSEEVEALLAADEIAQAAAKAKSGGYKPQQLPLNARQKAAKDAADAAKIDIPFACLICKKPFVDPVVTRCGHYFDETCALKHHATSPRCAVCNKPTLGIFNKANNVVHEKATEVLGD